jgi:hypothetical protein
VNNKDYAQFVNTVFKNLDSNSTTFYSVNSVCDQVCKLAKKHIQLSIDGCNLGQTPYREKRGVILEQKMLDLALSIGCVGIEFDYDPRGGGPRLLVKTGYSNSWSGSGIVIPR